MSAVRTHVESHCDTPKRRRRWHGLVWQCTCGQRWTLVRVQSDLDGSFLVWRRV